MRVLITGGAGFVEGHVAEYYARKGYEVVVFDNLSRAELLGHETNMMYNWNYLKRYENVELKILVVFHHQLKFTSSRYNFNLSLYKS